MAMATGPPLPPLKGGLDRWTGRFAATVHAGASVGTVEASTSACIGRDAPPRRIQAAPYLPTVATSRWARREAAKRQGARLSHPLHCPVSQPREEGVALPRSAGAANFHLPIGARFRNLRPDSPGQRQAKRPRERKEREKEERRNAPPASAVRRGDATTRAAERRQPGYASSVSLRRPTEARAK